ADAAPARGEHESRAGAPPGRVGVARAEEEQQQQPPPQQAREMSTAIVGPRAPVTVEALPELGIIIVSGNNPDDVEAVLKIIDYIKSISPQAEIQIKLVPLDNADATAVVNTLNQVFARVNVGVSAHTASPQPATTNDEAHIRA